jgi:hypothetical protein
VHEGMDEAGIVGVVLPDGRVLTEEIRSFNYNQHVNALRFSYETTTTKPVGVDSMSGWVRSVDTAPGRVVVIAHKFFRYRDQVYVQDADIKQLVRAV